MQNNLFQNAWPAIAKKIITFAKSKKKNSNIQNILKDNEDCLINEGENLVIKFLLNLTTSNSTFLQIKFPFWLLKFYHISSIKFQKKLLFHLVAKK